MGRDDHPKRAWGREDHPMPYPKPRYTRAYSTRIPVEVDERRIRLKERTGETEARLFDRALRALEQSLDRDDERASS
jgi:hypothetical protein